ncbi:MAG: nitrilase-related carbon-nitrogen hydrolase, partial [Vulcanimicrobiaceae bacterium]
MDSLKRPREIAVGVLQLRAHDREAFPTVWPSVLQRIERAAACGARLVVLPEGTVPAYVIGYEPYDPSPTERAIEELREIARRTRSVIVVGAARQDGGRLYNGALTIDGDGSVAGWADKQFL